MRPEPALAERAHHAHAGEAVGVRPADELLLPVAQQDVVVGPLVVEVLAGRPQAQVKKRLLTRIHLDFWSQNPAKQLNSSTR